jgi:hypothetical protein
MDAATRKDISTFGYSNMTIHKDFFLHKNIELSTNYNLMLNKKQVLAENTKLKRDKAKELA